MAKNEMTPVRWSIVLGLADSGMKVCETARKLYMNHSTVLYHLKFIKAITGLNPLNFYDLNKLVAMANGIGGLMERKNNES